MANKISHYLLSVFLTAGVWITGAILTGTAQAEEEVPSIAASSAPAWLEERQDAASFASDWLADLDNGDYGAAAGHYKLGENRGEAVKELRDLRNGSGKLISRTYNWSNVVAIANDDSEVVVQVSYTTEFLNMTLVELVDVLSWPNATVVLEYSIEEE